MPSLSPCANTSFLKIRSKPYKHVLLIIDLAKWAPRITKIWLREMNTQNERGGRAKLLSSLIQLKIILGSNARCLFGPGSTWTSRPKLAPTPLILLGSSPPWRFLVPFSMPRFIHAVQKGVYSIARICLLYRLVRVFIRSYRQKFGPSERC